ncbi:hypothetical protein Tco_1393508, partial [Tanacetum coccineum]
GCYTIDDEDDGAVADINNLDTTIQVSPVQTTRIHKDHPLDQVIRDLQSDVQTRKMSKNLEEHGNKKDERGIVIRNKARLVAQGYTQEEGIDYDESTVVVKTINGEAQLHALVNGKKIIIIEASVRRDLQLADEKGVECLPNSTIFEQLALMGKPKRKDTHVPQSSDPIDNIADEAVHKELGDSLVRAATTASSLEAQQDSGNINKTQSKATPNEYSSLGTTSGGGSLQADGPTVPDNHSRDTIAQTRFENVSKHSNDSLLARGNTLRSDEDRLKLDELMALCTTLQNRVLDLEKTKTTQQNEIASLKRTVKKLEKKNRSRTHKLKRLYKVGLTARVESSDDEESVGDDASKQGRIDAIDADE